MLGRINCQGFGFELRFPRNSTEEFDARSEDCYHLKLNTKRRSVLGGAKLPVFIATILTQFGPFRVQQFLPHLCWLKSTLLVVQLLLSQANFLVVQAVQFCRILVGDRLQTVSLALSHWDPHIFRATALPALPILPREVPREGGLNPQETKIGSPIKIGANPTNPYTVLCCFLGDDFEVVDFPYLQQLAGVQISRFVHMFPLLG